LISLVKIHDFGRLRFRFGQSHVGPSGWDEGRRDRHRPRSTGLPLRDKRNFSEIVPIQHFRDDRGNDADLPTLNRPNAKLVSCPVDFRKINVGKVGLLKFPIEVFSEIPNSVNDLISSKRFRR
jgi:hypothetical protein